MGHIGFGSEDQSATATDVGASQAADRRLTSRVLWAWRDLYRGTASLPHRSELAASGFGDDWHSCFTLDLGAARTAGALSEAVFVHVGKSVIELTDAGSALEGRPLAEVMSSAAETLLTGALQHVGIVLERRAPLIQGGEVAFRGRGFLYRSVLLPLVGDTGDIDMLLGALNGRAVTVGAVAAAVPEGRDGG